MKEVMIKGLPTDREVTLFAAVRSKDTKTTKSDKPYLIVQLVDKTGELEGRIWDDVETIGKSFEVDDVVKVRGPMSEYRGKPQISIKQLRKAEPEEIDASDYLPASERDPQQMFDELYRVGESMRNEHLKGLCLHLLTTHEAAIKRSPAAKGMHHAFVGGLLEHVLGLIHMAKATVGVYPWLDEDLLVTSCILHDLGKIEEITVKLTFGMSARGAMLGHIAIGLEMIQGTIAADPSFPPELKMLVEHLVIAHHGRPEWGTMKVPMIPEAIAFHELDMLDARLQMAKQALAGPIDKDGFTDWTKGLDVKLYAGGRNAGSPDEGGGE
jgi:3'-5' exoribonuclease